MTTRRPPTASGRPGRVPGPDAAASSVVAAVLAALLALALAATAGLAETTKPAADNEAAASSDAQSYADAYGVALSEAEERLELQAEAGRLEAELSTSRADTFAGLWVRHEPEFGVVVRITGDNTAATASVARETEGGPLEGLVEVEPAGTSLEDLEDLRQEAAAAAATSGRAQADTAVDVKQNRVEVTLQDAPPAPSELGRLAESKREPVALVGTEGAGKIRPAQSKAKGSSGASYGGLRLVAKGGGFCTSGFSVRGRASSGVTTAAHCPRTLYRGKAKPPHRLPFRGQRFGGLSDVQWHATPRSADRARVRFGRGQRSVRASTQSAYQPVGAYVCKFGARTGRTCGTISGKWYAPGYVPHANATFVGVASERPLVGPGDSGGPFLSGTAAYWTTVAYSRSGSTHYGYYIPVDYLGSLGVRVITR